MKRTKIRTVHGQPIPDVNNSFTKEMRSDRAAVKTLVYFELMAPGSGSRYIKKVVFILMHNIKNYLVTQHQI